MCLCEKRLASFEYGRYGNYTTIVAEEKISALEGAESTILMASGMCVSTVMLMALIPAGGHLITTTDCYRKTQIFIETVLPRMGITVAVFFTESPTNPFLRCVDIELVSKICHEKGALVCIDGTFGTPLNQKLLSLGADIILHSATKYIGGHNDVLAGSISGPEKLISVVRNFHHILGGALNPNAAYLIIRGMKTLHLRIRQQNSTAQRMAEMLEPHPKIRRVYYPGLASHPEHDLAKRQMKGFGGVVDGDLLTTAKFIDALKIPYIAPSFGGCESIVDQPAIMSYWTLALCNDVWIDLKKAVKAYWYMEECFKPFSVFVVFVVWIVALDLSQSERAKCGFVYSWRYNFLSNSFELSVRLFIQSMVSEAKRVCVLFAIELDHFDEVELAIAFLEKYDRLGKLKISTWIKFRSRDDDPIGFEVCGRLRVAFQDILNMIVPKSVSAAHQRALLLEQQQARKAGALATSSIKELPGTVVPAPSRSLGQSWF
ncbi:cystathionine gamma synthase [Striga asiatica]|uniref:Cystathionine gamma synthase n=1 Tax=Striga asiatica TaxID=4170 RepID=A0A5A7PX09_STRAF|nr:cystathionine gamma synthase [Striga asiatica]